MSLIYDYLKIIGQSGFEGNPDVEIPSALKRRYTNRFNIPSLLLLLGSCLVGALVIFFVSKIFITGRELRVAVVNEPVAEAQLDQTEPVVFPPNAEGKPAAEPAAPFRLVQPEPIPSSPEAGKMPASERAAATEHVGLQKIIVVPEKHKPEIVDATVSTRIVESPAIEQEVLPEKPVLRETEKPLIVDATGSRQIVRSQAIEQEVVPKKAVLRETEKPLIVDATGSRQIVESPAIEQGVMRRESRQPLELKSVKRKIVFSKNVPVYPEPKKAATDFSVIPGESTAPEAESSSSPGKGSAALEKSGKFYQAGLQAQYKGDGRIAELYYNKALEEVPRHMDAMINLSALYVQQGRYTEAEKILAEILAIEPTNSKALVNMGMVSLYQDNEARAAAQFEAALAANPREENALVNLAYLAEKNRDYLATEKYYRQLLQISPDNLEVLLAYGHLLEEQGRYPEAMALYAETLELGPVKKDRRLYNKISDRMRLLTGVLKNSQP